MTWLGIIGRVGSGKSTVASLIHEAFGLPVVELDHIGWAVLELPDVIAAIAQQISPDVRQPNGQIDRSRLGRIVFQDPVALARLNSISHPAIRAQLPTPTTPSLLVGALIDEIGLRNRCQTIVTVDRADADILASNPKAARILPHQASRDMFQARGDWVLHNTTPDQLRTDALALFKQLLSTVH